LQASHGWLSRTHQSKNSGTITKVSLFFCVAFKAAASPTCKLFDRAQLYPYQAAATAANALALTAPDRIAETSYRDAPDNSQGAIAR
jgi:hypothetical protein